jgi:hypothetical protein
MLYKELLDLFKEVRADFHEEHKVELSMALALEGDMFYCRFGFVGQSMPPLTLKIDKLEEEQDELETTKSLKQFIKMYYKSVLAKKEDLDKSMMSDIGELGSTAETKAAVGVSLTDREMTEKE